MKRIGQFFVVLVALGVAGFSNIACGAKAEEPKTSTPPAVVSPCAGATEITIHSYAPVFVRTGRVPCSGMGKGRHKAKPAVTTPAPAPAPVTHPAPPTPPKPIITVKPTPAQPTQQNPFAGAGIFAPTPAGVVEIIDDIIRSARPVVDCCPVPARVMPNPCCPPPPPHADIHIREQIPADLAARRDALPQKQVPPPPSNKRDCNRSKMVWSENRCTPR